MISNGIRGSDSNQRVKNALILCLTVLKEKMCPWGNGLKKKHSMGRK
jgi:hypothetical protein